MASPLRWVKGIGLAVGCSNSGECSLECSRQSACPSENALRGEGVSGEGLGSGGR